MILNQPVYVDIFEEEEVEERSWIYGRCIQRVMLDSMYERSAIAELGWSPGLE